MSYYLQSITMWGFTCYNKVGWDHKGKQRETRDQQKGHSGSNEGPKAGTQ